MPPSDGAWSLASTGPAGTVCATGLGNPMDRGEGGNGHYRRRDPPGVQVRARPLLSGGHCAPGSRRGQHRSSRNVALLLDDPARERLYLHQQCALCTLCRPGRPGRIQRCRGGGGCSRGQHSGQPGAGDPGQADARSHCRSHSPPRRGHPRWGGTGDRSGRGRAGRRADRTDGRIW